MGKRIIMPILDVKTGKEYPSKAAAGRDLAHLVKGDPKNNFVFFEIQRKMPERFRTPNAKGEWVPLDDPSAPVGSLRVRDDESPRAESTAGTRLTTLEIDASKFTQVRTILRTRTLRETVDRSFDEVLARAARSRSIARLQNMDGLDLDKPSVMDKAWR